MSRTKHHRSKKKSIRVPADFKKVRRQGRRAKEKQAIREKKYDNIPTFRKSDEYDYF
jgi:hypothetical protein